MANVPPASPTPLGDDKDNINYPPPPPQYVSVPPPSDYSYQNAPPPIPLVPPPPSYPASTLNVETPPPLPPPTAPHFDDDDEFHNHGHNQPTAPPPPPLPEMQQPPQPAPPAKTKVDVEKPGAGTTAGVPTTGKKMSFDELPAYIGFFALGCLLGLTLSLFSFTFNCCMSTLKNKPVRRNFFNAGCACGAIAQIGLLYLAIKRTLDRFSHRQKP